MVSGKVATMARRFPLLMVMLVLLLGLAYQVAVAPPVRAQGTGGEIVVLTIDGPITPVVARYIERGLDDAAARNARAVVIAMDTPGGLDTAMRAIIQRMLASRVPVITYVSPVGARAASAGTFISYAAHLAAMAPSTSIGSASPVSIGSGGEEQSQSDTMTAKVTNDAVSLIRGLAERHGRNADWAERAVREAANLTASEAREQQVVDIVASDLDDLLRQAHGRTVTVAEGTATLATEGASVQPIEPSAIEAFLQLIADPTLAYLMLSLGMLGLYLEFANPGSTLPGVAGAILVVMALFSLGSLPVTWAGLLLIALALALFVADLLIVGHGLLSAGGAVAFGLGSLLLIDTNAPSGLQISPWAIGAVSLGLGLCAVAIASVVMRDRQRRPTTGCEGLVGAVAVTHTPLAPVGLVFIEGERWTAISQAGPVPAGRSVRVLAVEGLTLLVAPAVAAATFSSIVKIMQEYERAVVFRLGRLVGVRGPGVVFIVPGFYRMLRVDLRTITMDIPAQEVITRDNVTIRVNAVAYFRVVDPSRAVVNVADYIRATSQIAQTTLRSVMGQVELDELLAERDRINDQLQVIIDQQTEPWGVKVSIVEVKDIELPDTMQRAMARQAEAEREKRAKVIHASGELDASRQLTEAAELMARVPTTIQLRYLQTLTEIAAEKNSTIVFPLPVQLLDGLNLMVQGMARGQTEPRREEPRSS